MLQLIKYDNKKDDEVKEYDRIPIQIHLNSYGGDLYEAFALISIILESKTPIYTYCNGIAHSSAFMIFIAGHKRYITKHANMIIHQFCGGAYGTYKEIKDNVNGLDKMWQDIRTYILKQTAISKNQIDDVKDKNFDWWVFGDELINLGIADEEMNAFY